MFPCDGGRWCETIGSADNPLPRWLRRQFAQPGAARTPWRLCVVGNDHGLIGPSGAQSQVGLKGGPAKRWDGRSRWVGTLRRPFGAVKNEPRVAQGLRGEEFSEDGEDLHPGLGAEAAETADEPGFVDRADLVEDDLPGLALESAGDAGRGSRPRVVIGATMWVRRWRFISSGEMTRHGRVFRISVPTVGPRSTRWTSKRRITTPSPPRPTPYSGAPSASRSALVSGRGHGPANVAVPAAAGRMGTADDQRVVAGLDLDLPVESGSDRAVASGRRCPGGIAESARSASSSPTSGDYIVITRSDLGKPC